jgi:Protein of unknown function (DUF3667)
MSLPPVPVVSGPVVSAPEPPLPQTLVCANCGAPLTGEYCATCGQRYEPHVHTLKHFAAEAFESITHADSRVWRTFGYLLTRPGLLTREFLNGRRVSYLPPFRLYLVISVVFFLVGMPTKLNVNTRGAGETESSQELLKQAKEFEAADSPIPAGVRKQTLKYLRAEAAKAAAREATGVKPAAAADGAEDEGETNNNVNVSSRGLSDLSDFCDSLKKQAAAASGFRKNLADRCQRLANGGGASLGEVVTHNVPRAMFIFLPLLALVMKSLYWRPKRYYVEHLLFLVHNHAFVFLAATVQILASWIPHSAAFMPWFGTAINLYMVWYIYRAMRNVYGQSRGLTLAKYFTLGFAYIVTSMVMLLLTVIYSALTL